MTAQNLIGPVVRRLREGRSLTQDAFAARCQLAGWTISRAGISKIEAGLRLVNDAELLVLARVCGCSVANLFPLHPRNLGAVLRQGRG